MVLSFIVPVYNAASYLLECLQSLENQDLDAGAYEIICVDDGSWDESPELLRSFAAEHNNVVVIRQENSGVAAARNAGLQAAKGEYIWFIDADDFLMPNVAGELCEKIAQTGCDRLTVDAYQFEDQLTAKGEYIWFIDADDFLMPNVAGELCEKIAQTGCDRLTVDAYQFEDQLTEQEQEAASQGTLLGNAPWYDSVVWRSLIRRAFLLNHGLSFRYPSLTHGEDGLFMYEFNRCQPVSVDSGKMAYFYREHSGSAETARSLENSWKKLNSYRQIVTILDGYAENGGADAVTADLRMRFLWFALQEAAKMPWGQTWKALGLLHQQGLFPGRCLPQRQPGPAFVTQRTDWLGKAYEGVYQHLHRPWGFICLWLAYRVKNWIR